MPEYEFKCPNEHRALVVAHADDRDKLEITCEFDGLPMKRIPTAPMAVLWAGRFHSPWAKKKDGEW